MGRFWVILPIPHPPSRPFTASGYAQKHRLLCVLLCVVELRYAACSFVEPRDRRHGHCRRMPLSPRKRRPYQRQSPQQKLTQQPKQTQSEARVGDMGVMVWSWCLTSRACLLRALPWNAWVFNNGERVCICVRRQARSGTHDCLPRCATVLPVL